MTNNSKFIITPGIYLINKPRGRSSFSMVAQVRRLSGIKKVGHAGTLDPQAEGLLIVLVGREYTKLSDTFLKQDKVYEFGLRLGKKSTTGDSEGTKTVVSAQKPPKKAILAALEPFRGQITQQPPIYSAIKIDGQRAYKMAREGKTPEMPSRMVEIFSLELVSYSYPYVQIRAHVSSGTYIRSLGADIGLVLGTGAYCTHIKRTSIGEFGIEKAITLD